MQNSCNYDSNINLTSTVLSVTVLSSNDQSDNFVSLKYVHVGMCVLTVLKYYFASAEIIPNTLFDKLKSLLTDRGTEIEPIIHDWYDEYISTNE